MKVHAAAAVLWQQVQAFDTFTKHTYLPYLPERRQRSRKPKVQAEIVKNPNGYA